MDMWGRTLICSLRAHGQISTPNIDNSQSACTWVTWFSVRCVRFRAAVAWAARESRDFVDSRVSQEI